MKRWIIFLPVCVFLWSLIVASNSVEARKYVGTDGCKCHKTEIADWERSKHAEAFDLLKPGKKASKKKKAGLDPDKDYTTDEKCVKCHVTGYNEEGGFKNIGSTAAMAGVGCEECHGPGGDYRGLHKEKTTKFTKAEAKAAGETYGSLDASVCTRCHGHKDSPFRPEIDEKYKFNHKEALKNEMAFHKLYPLEGTH